MLYTFDAISYNISSVILSFLQRILLEIKSI